MITQLVISRYNENINWVDDLKLPYIIYNKGQTLPDHPNTQRPNVGREAETWLYHIITHYNCLAEYTIFLQGDPYDHCKILNKILQDFPKNLHLAHLYNTGCWGLAEIQYKETAEHVNSIGVHPELLYGSKYKADLYCFSNGAQYAVHQTNILSKPLKYYKQLYDNITWTPSPYNYYQEHAPWSIERIWPAIFKNANHSTIRTQ